MNETLKEMWDTRPPRIPKKQGGNAIIAGICEGIAVRYRIDVLLVRVAFVALSFVFGVGLFTYILCGFLMPRFGMAASPAEVISRPNEELTDAERDDRTTGWVLLVLLIIFFPTLSVGAGGELVFSAIGGLALAAVAWWALHQRTPVPPAGLVVPPSPQKPREPKTQPEPPVTARFTPPEGYEHPAGPEPAAPTPPAWDPLGAAPGLWHLPDPALEPAPEPEPKKKSSRLWLWIPVALLVAAPLVFGVGVSDRIGEVHLAYEDAQSIPDVNNLVGEMNVDLSNLAPLKEPKTVNFNNGIGEINILLPNNVPVEVHCQTSIGETTCPSGKHNADKDGELLTINVKHRIGSVSAQFAE
ncbi:PspC domain-containing protein [Corynebacterium meitnerae]|uniref:PspC domain-containing protein n=1 Tax=Corynebacterium meitnerae TaxID=2913498 RepID=A0A9X3RLS8_9CORY|nr:PspC domain-containing protein [Corynebacterium meitnerae]MCZ9293913.1 PspC domain-containing protein [Corynebacterium meitnerae]